mgnify:CR=1 FL=1
MFDDANIKGSFYPSKFLSYFFSFFLIFLLISSLFAEINGHFRRI